MTARRPGILGLMVALLLLAPLVLLLMASQTGALSSLPHIGLGGAPAAAPANSGHATVDQQPSSSESQMNLPAAASGSQSSAISAKPPVAVKSGGPEDAGPDVVGQAPAGKSICAPKVCHR